jgi:hypothetical protein
MLVSSELMSWKGLHSRCTSRYVCVSVCHLFIFMGIPENPRAVSLLVSVNF